jgi:two-component system nitrate/nitrite sensor histidine kinase NarX
LALLEERAVIARELHDSLAQSLSYLKIQVGRLQLLPGGAEAAAQARDIVTELREGLNGAYRQLRELIATFRLKMEHPRLEDSLTRSSAGIQSPRPTADRTESFWLELRA